MNTFHQSLQIKNDNYSSLNKKTIKELHQLCRIHGVKNYSKLRKMELLELLQKLDKKEQNEETKIEKFMKKVSTRYNIPIEELQKLHDNEHDEKINPIIPDNRINYSNSICDIHEKNITYTKLQKIINNSHIDHRNEIIKCTTMKNAHIYCKTNNINSQKYGSLLEYYIHKKFEIKRNLSSSLNGDFCLQNSNIELKVSLGTKKFNYVQLRLNHNCDYIFTAYHINEYNLKFLGELFIFYLKKSQLKILLSKYGNYAHGTISRLGKITIESLEEKDNDKEYCIRPIYNSNCWEEFLKYRINEIQLRDILCK